MNAAITIVARELRERTRLFIVAAALAILPFIVAMMPNMQNQRGLTIATLSGMSAINYAFAIALLLGVSIVGRDLSEKRLSFYFAKPIPSWALWAGKAGAALLIVIAVAAIIAVPGMLVAFDHFSTVWGGGQWVVMKVSAIAALFFLFGGHAISTMVRSRSALVALDFVLAVTTLIATFFIVRPLLFRGSLQLAVGVLEVIAFALLVILAVAPVWQISRGRADARRNHSALSRALWPALGATLLVAASYTGWMTSATVESFDQIHDLAQSRDGQWIFVTGGDHARKNLPATYLLHTPSGTNQRVNIAPWTEAKFSRDGNVLAWTEPAEIIPRRGGVRIMTRALEPDAKARDTGITAHLSDKFAISDDGSRLAVLDYERIRVYDLASGKLLMAAAGIPRGEAQSMFFAGPSRLRVTTHRRGAGQAELYEVNVDGKKLAKTGAMQVPVGFTNSSVSANASGSLFYLNRQAAVIDPNSGNVIAKLPFQPESNRASVMLGDGRIVWVTRGMLRLYDSTGAPLREIPLPLARGLVIGEIGKRKVMIMGRETEPNAPEIRGRRILVVDLENGTVEKTVKDMFGPSMWWGGDPRLPAFAEGATFAAMDAEKKLAYWK